jgi:hypothetical protein
MRTPMGHELKHLVELVRGCPICRAQGKDIHVDLAPDEREPYEVEDGWWYVPICVQIRCDNCHTQDMTLEFSVRGKPGDSYFPSE